MTRLFLILALLAQAPKSSPTPLTADNRGVTNIEVQDNGLARLTLSSVYVKGTTVIVRDGDMPVGPCDLGKLVRAARSHMKLEHPPLPSNMLCLNKATQSWGTCLGDPAPVPLSEDFNSWEVCGDEGDGGWGTFTYPTPALPRDAKMLREMADCIDRRAEKRKRAAKWQEEQEAKRAKVEADLRAEIALCEPKKPEPGR